MCSSVSPWRTGGTRLARLLIPSSSRFVADGTGPPASSLRSRNANRTPSRYRRSNRRQRRRSRSCTHRHSRRDACGFEESSLAWVRSAMRSRHRAPGVRRPVRLQLEFGGLVHARAPGNAESGCRATTGGTPPTRHAARTRLGRRAQGSARTAPCRPSALMRAPLPVQHLAGVPVNRDDQAPAVAHARAVRHRRMTFHPHRRRRRADVPAPGGPLAQGPCVAGGGRRSPASTPCTSTADCPPSSCRYSSSISRTPSTGAPARLRPHTPMQRARTGRNPAN